MVKIFENNNIFELNLYKYCLVANIYYYHQNKTINIFIFSESLNQYLFS